MNEWSQFVKNGLLYDATTKSLRKKRDRQQNMQFPLSRQPAEVEFPPANTWLYNAVHQFMVDTADYGDSAI